MTVIFATVPDVVLCSGVFRQFSFQSLSNLLLPTSAKLVMSGVALTPVLEHVVHPSPAL